MKKETELNFLEGFVEEFGGKQDTPVKMRAGRELLLPAEILNHLGFEAEDFGKNGLAHVGLRLNIAQKKLLMTKCEKNKGFTIGGTPKRAEIYCKKTCDKILVLLGKQLTGTGTVGFTDVEMDATDDGMKYLMVDLSSYVANEGVLIDKSADVESEVA